MVEATSAKADALHKQRDWLLVTLCSIGDAVITTDREGMISFLNPVAEALTGWNQEAVGKPLENVIRLINEDRREPVEVPTVEALTQRRTHKLPDHSLLIAKDGTERSISDSAALIRNDKGEIAGLVLVFRDITERRNTERALARTQSYADDIIETLREPFLVLDSDLRVKTANRAFYESFQSRKRKRKSVWSTTWETDSGKSRRCGSCLKRSSPETRRFMILKSSIPFPLSGKRRCC
jgi:PAS domain S-box-containing protein